MTLSYRDRSYVSGCEGNDREEVRGSKKEVRHGEPQSHAHNIRYVLRRRIGEVTEKETTIQLGSIHQEWTNRPKILTRRNVPINNLNYKDTRC